MQQNTGSRDKNLTWHGGASGARDEGLLESAKEPPSLAVLAAAYGSGIVGTLPFVDGNKRTGLVVAFTFIEANGFIVTASQEEAYFAFHNLAAGKLSEEELAHRLDANTGPVSS
ncbi:MAG: type II toxin-antitoxin system death-on-curing family toxin [Acidobacteriaceae bacterium]